MLVWVFAVTELAQAAQAADAGAAGSRSADRRRRGDPHHFRRRGEHGLEHPVRRRRPRPRLGNGTGAGESLSASGRELAARRSRPPPVSPPLSSCSGRYRSSPCGSRFGCAGCGPPARHAQRGRRTPSCSPCAHWPGCTAHRLLDVTPDPAGAWRRAEPDAVAGLAALELSRWGCGPPRRTHETGPSGCDGPPPALRSDHAVLGPRASTKAPKGETSYASAGLRGSAACCAAAADCRVPVRPDLWRGRRGRAA